MQGVRVSEESRTQQSRAELALQERAHHLDGLGLGHRMHRLPAGAHALLWPRLPQASPALTHAAPLSLPTHWPNPTMHCLQAITFSSASRYEIVGSALNITQSSVNAL